MAVWQRVKWTEAGQVADLLGWTDRLPGERAASPAETFHALRAAGRRDDAVFFLAAALPRYESVGWAVRCVRDIVGEPNGREAAALRAALLWVSDPSDARRRAAFEAAAAAPDVSPATVAAFAVFLSGGSMAPDGLEPVPAPKDSAAQLAAAAILLAVDTVGDRNATLERVLAIGDCIAASGLDAAA